jgi:hypothetical protein
MHNETEIQFGWIKKNLVENVRICKLVDKDFLEEVHFLRKKRTDGLFVVVIMTELEFENFWKNLFSAVANKPLDPILSDVG